MLQGVTGGAQRVQAAAPATIATPEASAPASAAPEASAAGPESLDDFFARITVTITPEIESQLKEEDVRDVSTLFMCTEDELRKIGFKNVQVRKILQEAKPKH